MGGPSSAAPSTSTGTNRPCQWTCSGVGVSLCTSTVTDWPSRRRSSGPGTEPLYPVVLIVRRGAISISTGEMRSVISALGFSGAAWAARRDATLQPAGVPITARKSRRSMVLLCSPRSLYRLAGAPRSPRAHSARHKARLRRDRIRQARHNERLSAPPPPDVQPSPALPPRFAAERGMREIQALLEGQEFASDDDHNAKLAELMRGGRLHEKANAWKRDDPKWRAQELAYDALEASDPVEALRLVHEALKLDPDCTEAQHPMVSLAPMHPPDARNRRQGRAQHGRELHSGEHRPLLAHAVDAALHAGEKIGRASCRER